MDAHMETFSARLLLFLALTQLIYGMVLCVYLYGRKVSTTDDFGALMEDDPETEESDEEEELEQ